jgi:hypothetical protein
LDVTTIFDEAYRARSQDPVLDELIGRGYREPGTLFEREHSQFFAWMRADMNSLEATWFFRISASFRRKTLTDSRLPLEAVY